MCIPHGVTDEHGLVGVHAGSVQYDLRDARFRFGGVHVA
jgi:hypothetical protein